MISVLGPDGERKVLEGTAYVKKPGEVEISGDGRDGVDALTERIGMSVGVPVGKAMALLLKPLAIAMGKEDCTTCQGRKLALDFFTRLIQKDGSIKAVLSLKELFEIAGKGDPIAVASRIREML